MITNHVNIYKITHQCRQYGDMMKFSTKNEKKTTIKHSIVECKFLQLTAKLDE